MCDPSHQPPPQQLTWCDPAHLWRLPALALPLADPRYQGEGTDLIAHNAAVLSATWSHDGTMVLTASTDRCGTGVGKVCDFSALGRDPSQDPLLKHFPTAANVLLYCQAPFLRCQAAHLLLTVCELQQRLGAACIPHACSPACNSHHDCR